MIVRTVRLKGNHLIASLHVPSQKEKTLQDLRSFQFVDKFLLQPLPGSKSTSSLSPKIFGVPTIRQPSHEEKLITCRWSRCLEVICEKKHVSLSRSTKDSTKKKRIKTIVGPSDLEVTTSWLEYWESQVWMNDSHSNPIFFAKVAQFHHQVIKPLPRITAKHGLRVKHNRHF